MILLHIENSQVVTTVNILWEYMLFSLNFPWKGTLFVQILESTLKMWKWSIF